MGVGQTVSGWYSAVEDKFFDFADWLEEKGIPIYGYTNFLEEKGIPAFPVTVALLIVILSLFLWLFLFNAPGTTVLALSLHDDSGQTLSGINLLVVDSGTGKTVFSGKKNHGDTVELSGVGPGAELAVTASKDGFESAAATIKVNKVRIDTALLFKKIFQSVNARFRLIDSQSGRPISSAQVTLRWGANFVRSDKTDANGNFSAFGVPANEEVRIEIKADNYEELAQPFKFSAGSIPTISLVPKGTASFGQANLIVNTFDKTTKSPLSDVFLRIINPENLQEFAQVRTVNGQFVLDLPKGTVFKIIAQKPGYSLLVTQDQTLRSDPQTINLELEQGGTKVTVVVFSKDSNAELFNATVGLYDSQANLIAEQLTPFAGSVEFENLSSDQNYFVSAYRENFLPQTVEFSPFDTSEIHLTLEGQTSQNTGTLNVIVTDSSGFASPNTGLAYFEIVGERKFPTGLPKQTTEYDGFAKTIVPSNKTISVEARKGVEFGENRMLILSDKQNDLPIQMKPVDSAKLLRVFNEENNPFGPGGVLVKSLNGVTLLDSNLTDLGTALFDARTYKIVDITITNLDGNTFNQQANVEGIKEVIIRWRTGASEELVPNIQYLGIVDETGKPAQGLTAEKDHWLSFQVDWPQSDTGYRGGVHVRLGSDQIKFVESDVAGILGFDAGGVSSFFYGRSYTAFPSPGNEALDFGNPGKAGELSKWLELYFDKPTGSQLVKVRVQLKSGIGTTAIPVHYRAWSVFSDQYFRQPQDIELSIHKFTATKTGLYAKTLDEELPLFAGSSLCDKDVCADFGFVSQDEGRMEPKGFQALKGKLYALEVTVRSKTDQVLLVSASTGKTMPLLFFTGAEVESFTDFLDYNDSRETQIEVNDVSVVADRPRTVRLYFKPVQAGNTSIKAQVVGDDSVITQDFFFNVFESAQMNIAVAPETINVGEPFTITLTDVNNSRIINNATIQIRNEQGQIVLSTVGNNQAKSGKDGQYVFKNALQAGTYLVTATAFGFAPVQTQILIGQGGLLRLPEEIEIKIAQGQTTNQVSVPLENISRFTINDLEVQIQKPDNWPLELDAIGGTVSSLKARQRGTLDITATFLGDTNQIITGNADITIHGIVGANGYPTTAKARLVVTYNQPLDVNCLVFNPSELTVFMTANQPFNQFESPYYPYGGSPYGAGGYGVNNSYGSGLGSNSSNGSSGGGYRGYGSSSFPYNSNYPYNGGSGSYAQSPYYPQMSQQQYTSDPSQYNANYTPQYNRNDQYYDQRQGVGSQPRFLTNDQPYYNSQPSSPYYNNSTYGGSGPYNGNGNIYSPNYNQYDQTQKEVEVQVTNNCGVPFEFKTQVIPKTGNAADKTIDVVVPGFSIQANETVTATIQIFNKTERFLPRPEEKKFDILFTNPYTKVLPLKIILWDSKFALAAPDRIDLYLSQSMRGEPVITSSPLYLRNVGAEDISRLDIQVGGDSYSEGANIRIVPYGEVPMLARGQVVFPPKMVIAESRGGTDKGRLVHSYLTVSGEINGKYYQLRTIDVWVHISALDCLVLTPVDDLLFSNAVSNYGTIDKKVRIRNTCEEPVRVVGIEPRTAGPNPLALVPLSTNLLNRDFEAEFLIRLVKQADYKNPNMGIAVGGLLQTTQKFISSNRLQAQIELGESAVATGLASQPFTLDVCVEEGVAKGSKEATRFPKISTSTECTKGYCDAVHASEFLATKLRDKISQVQTAVNEGANELSNFQGCVNTAPSKACTFTELGVTPEAFDLFLQNDQLTPNLLQKTIAETGPAELQGYAINYCFGPQCDVKAIAQTGFPNLLYLSDAFRGCGRYRVTINGAVFASQSQVRNEGFVLSVNVTQRLLTPECTNQIENVSNFLPVDKGLTGDSTFDAWPGIVEAESRLAEVGAAFARELFDGQEGRVFETANGNKIILKYGEVQGGIIKLEMDPTSGTDSPKTIIATINQALDTKKISLQGTTQNPQSPVKDLNKDFKPDYTVPVRNDLAQEAAAAVSALKKQRIQSGKGCISQDHTYMILGSPEKLGEIQLNAPSKLGVLADQTVCADVNIVSDVKENIRLVSNADEIINATPAVGISKIEFKNPATDTALASNDALKLEYNEALRKYTGSTQVCVTGNEFYASAKKSKGLQLTGESSLDALRKSKTKIITLESCGIHPFDLLSQLQSKPAGEYYFSPGWLGAPEQASLNDLVNKANENNLNKPDTLLSTGNSDNSKNKTFSDAAKAKRTESILGFSWQNGFSLNNPAKSYLPICMVVSGICNGVKTIGLGGWIWGPLTDCVGPALWSVAPDVGGLKQAREALENSLGKYIGPIIGKITSWFEDKDAQALFNKDPNQLTAEQKAKLETARDFEDGFVGAVGARALLHGFAPKINYTNYSKIPIGTASKDIAADIAEDVSKQYVQGFAGRLLQSEKLPFTTARQVQTMVREELRPLIAQGLEANKRPFRALLDSGGINDVIQGAIEKAAPALDKRFTALAIEGKIKLPPNVSTAPLDLTVKSIVGGATIEGATEDAVKKSLSTKIISELQVAGIDVTPRVDKLINDTVNSTALTTKLVEGSKTPIEKGVVMTAANAESATKTALNALESVEKGSINKLSQRLGQEAGGLAKSMLEGKTGSISRFARMRKFLSALGRGVACTTLSNAAGMAAWKWGIQESPVNVPTDKIIGKPQVDSNGQLLRSANGDLRKDVILKKGKLYRAKITEKTVDGKIQRLWEIDEADPKTVPAKANYLTSDCEGNYATKPLDPKLFAAYGTSANISAPGGSAGAAINQNPSDANKNKPQ